MCAVNEVWKDINGYVGEYQVSNLGRVKSLPKYMYPNGYPQLRKEKLLKPSCTGKYRNYLAVCLRGKQYRVHRLVAEAFIPNPNNYPMVNHIDKNTLNNQVDNLEWCTNQYNVKYSAKPLSEEHKQKIRMKHIGKHLSEEHKRKISEAGKRRYLSEEERRKTSISTKLVWEKRKNAKSW